MKLSEKATQALSRFCEEGFYVYMRPTSSMWLDNSLDHFIYWNVDVEFRAVGWRHWKVSGPDLNEILKRLDAIVPAGEKIPGITKGPNDIDPNVMRTEITGAEDPNNAPSEPKKIKKSKKKKSKKGKK